MAPSCDSPRIEETALRGERIRVLECAEEPVPPRDIPKVEIMDVELVMDRVVLRSLNEPAAPM
jgi:hypothetical protein